MADPPEGKAPLGDSPTQPDPSDPTDAVAAAGSADRSIRSEEDRRRGHRYEVVIVGAGPSGACCAYWLAAAGFDVALIEKKRFPRDKTCGDGLTPRAVKQLYDMGLESELKPHHLYKGLRAVGFGRTMELDWPKLPGFPDHGIVVSRHDLDYAVANHAEKAGAVLFQECEATEVVRESGITTGVVVKPKDGEQFVLSGKYLVVADGSNSRIGRSLGSARIKAWPQGMAIRSYWESPRHDDPFIESHLDISDETGRVLPGYGWVFPMGDGRINLGVGILTAREELKGLNTTKLLEAFLRKVSASWQIDPEAACVKPTGGRLPMGLAVGPRTGPGYVMVGDACGSINPFNGEGISYAYETGRMAAQCLGAAISGGGIASLSRYDAMVEDAYSAYYRTARAFVRFIGKPEAMKVLAGTGMRSEAIMEIVLKVMANLMQPDHKGPAEWACTAAEKAQVVFDLTKGLVASVR